MTYSRFKHWFQYDTQMVAPKSTVVVAMFRDPYGEMIVFHSDASNNYSHSVFISLRVTPDWVEAMHERPHHAHSHMNLPWKEFGERKICLCSKS